MPRRRPIAAALFSSVLVLAGCGPQAERFVTSNARAHVNMLAEAIGSRPAGSDANRRAREYLVDQLQIAGLQVRVQETDARRADAGLAGRVANIVGIRQGQSDDAIAIVSHYDSVPDGPGAGDAAYGAAIAVEAARVLGASSMRHSLMVLLTDSEESGLLGAAGAMSDPAIRDRIAAYINLEAAGTSGTPLLFESGPGNGWLTNAWARHAPFPRGASFAVEIYKRMPNDTDFSILKRSGIPGLNFGLVRGGTAYHTDRDTAARLSDDSMTTGGENVVDIVSALDAGNLRERSALEPTYFDIGGSWAVSYGPIAALVIGIASLALGVLAWLRTMIAAGRSAGAWRVLLTVVWAIAGGLAVIAAMAGATWLLRGLREVYHPWYAHPGRAMAFVIASGVAAGWLLSRAGGLIRRASFPDRHPAMVWVAALPFWIAAAAAGMWFAPGAAFLATVPLLAAGVMLAGAPLHSGAAVRIISIVVFAVSASLWLLSTIDLLATLNALFGRLPVIAPVWIFAALLSACGLFVVPPFLAAATAGSRGLGRPQLFTAVVVLALAGTGLAAYFAEPYSSQDPLRRAARFIQHDGHNVAMWELGSNEPGLDVDLASGLAWKSDEGPMPDTVPVARLAHPFRFTAPATPVPTPASVSVVATPVDGATELSVTVRTDDPSAFVTLLLPSGMKPVRSTLPGIVSSASNRWRSTFVAPPPDGVFWRLVVPGGTETRLGETMVMVQTAGAVMPWMPRTRAAWQVRSLFLIPIGPMLPPPVPGVR